MRLVTNGVGKRHLKNGMRATAFDPAAAGRCETLHLQIAGETHAENRSTNYHIETILKVGRYRLVHSGTGEGYRGASETLAQEQSTPTPRSPRAQASN